MILKRLRRENKIYKKFKDYSFRELVGHFILMRNTNIVKNSQSYQYIDDGIEDSKQKIIKDTKEYYSDKYGYDEDNDLEDTFSLDALNEEMSTRKVSDLYEPLFGYIGIDKTRGYVLYLLGNIEDKFKYVYTPTYWGCHEESLKDIEIEIIEPDDYEHADRFKEQIQFEEELDEDVIKTRDISIIDPFRLENSPDFVTCIVPYKHADYNAKVKLNRIEKDVLYGNYHEQEGIIELVQNEDNSFLLFKPTEKYDDEEALKQYIEDVCEILVGDFGAEREDAKELMQYCQDEVERGYIKGDLAFEVAYELLSEIDDDYEETEEDSDLDSSENE